MEAQGKLISVEQFEEKIFEVEGIVIRVRANSSKLVRDYEFQRKASDTQKVADWLNTRVVPYLDGLEVSVIGGNFSNVVGQTSLGHLRNSYLRKS